MAAETEQITADAVEAILAEQGYDVSVLEPNVLSICDPESRIKVEAALEQNVLFLTVSCTTVPATAINLDLAMKMLDAQNGISTSSFQLYRDGSSKVAVTLNNFCKLQSMGADDQDDIISCVEFLLADVVVARRLLSDLKA